MLSRHIVGTASQPEGSEPVEYDSTPENRSRGVEMASTSGQQQIPSSYARIHGQVSRSPPVWRRVDVVAKEQLEEVLYDKAVGEGMVKVCISFCLQRLLA